MLHVGAEAPGAHRDGRALKLAQRAGQGEELQGFVERDGLDALFGLEGGKARLHVRFGRAELHHGSVAAYLHRYGLSCLRVGAQFAFAHLVVGLFGQRFFHLRLKVVVEGMDERCPVFFPLGHGVKVFFDVGREVVVHDFGEIFQQEVVHHEAHVGGYELVFLGPRGLGVRFVADGAGRKRQHVDGARFSLLFPLDNIFALLDGRDGGGVGRRTADAQLLHLVDERRLGVARRVLRVALLRAYLGGRELHALGHGGQQAPLGLVLVVGVVALAVDAQEAVELHHLARGRKLLPAAAHVDYGRRFFQFGVGHLAGYGALPYHVVEAFLLRGAVDGGAAHVGGAYGLVRLLGSLGVRVVSARVVVALAHGLRNDRAAAAQAELREVH